jgi:hypothetical protein
MGMSMDKQQLHHDNENAKNGAMYPAASENAT